MGYIIMLGFTYPLGGVKCTQLDRRCGQLGLIGLPVFLPSQP